jgi:hypothetical protein
MQTRLAVLLRSLRMENSRPNKFPTFSFSHRQIVEVAIHLTNLCSQKYLRFHGGYRNRNIDPPVPASRQSRRRLHTPHSTLHTPHSTLHTPHSTLHTPHDSIKLLLEYVHRPAESNFLLYKINALSKQKCCIKSTLVMKILRMKMMMTI